MLVAEGKGNRMADGLESRVRTLEEELNGERHVSRYQVEQAGRNSEVLHAVRAEVGTMTGRVDVLKGDMASVKAALAMHGRALDVLMQDVRQLRSGQDELRQDVSEIKARLDRMEEDVRQEVSEIKARLDRMEEEAATRHNELLAAIRAVVG
jgi:chromosome segregation ATPase